MWSRESAILWLLVVVCSTYVALVFSRALYLPNSGVLQAARLMLFASSCLPFIGLPARSWPARQVGRADMLEMDTDAVAANPKVWSVDSQAQ
jgi:hypothetical protein